MPGHDRDSGYVAGRCEGDIAGCAERCAADDGPDCYALALVLETRETETQSDEPVFEALYLRACRLGLVTGPDLLVKLGDARLTLARQPSARYQVVVGDAFGGRAVPWHLTTREFVTEVRRTLRPGGIYAANLIDFRPDGSATAAFVMPSCVNGRPAHRADPLANDQDWALFWPGYFSALLA